MRTAIAAALSLLLACGGSGTSDTSPAETPPPAAPSTPPATADHFTVTTRDVQYAAVARFPTPRPDVSYQVRAVVVSFTGNPPAEAMQVSEIGRSLETATISTRVPPKYGNTVTWDIAVW